MELWDGSDYYLGDMIVNNTEFGDRPSIDHKKSVMQCFAEGISPEECCAVGNLCVTRHRFNARKNAKTEDEFYEWIKKEKDRINR